MLDIESGLKWNRVCECIYVCGHRIERGDLVLVMLSNPNPRRYSLYISYQTSPQQPSIQKENHHKFE